MGRFEIALAHWDEIPKDTAIEIEEEIITSADIVKMGREAYCDLKHALVVGKMDWIENYTTGEIIIRRKNAKINYKAICKESKKSS